jgi:hypothetical protein
VDVGFQSIKAQMADGLGKVFFRLAQFQNAIHQGLNPLQIV